MKITSQPYDSEEAFNEKFRQRQHGMVTATDWNRPFGHEALDIALRKARGARRQRKANIMDAHLLRAHQAWCISKEGTDPLRMVVMLMLRWGIPETSFRAWLLRRSTGAMPTPVKPKPKPKPKQGGKTWAEAFMDEAPPGWMD